MAERSDTEALTDFERTQVLAMIHAEVTHRFNDTVHTVGDLKKLSVDKLLTIEKG
jgi:hypothetical protein